MAPRPSKSPDGKTHTSIQSDSLKGSDKLRFKQDKKSNTRTSAEQLRDAQATRRQEIAVESSGLENSKQVKKQKQTAFRLRHGLLVLLLGFFVILHGIGIYLFTNGFLLSRLVLTQRSKCGEPPVSLPEGRSALGTYDAGCWHPKTFKKAVIILIDALRYDFTVPFIPTDDQQKPLACHEALPLLYDVAVKDPQRAFLRPFIADPPTTTLQRLKALTTGTLPTFIDAGSNFAGTAIDEDNLIEQLVLAGKNVVHLGDDTWHALFPDYFEPNLTRPFPSLEVWDLHTVDNGVTDNLLPLLESSVPGDTRWDVIIGHFLGVDHAGHRYGPDHPAMTAKLQQMNHVLTRTMELVDDETLLVVMGDHGMDTKGDHGGESDPEVEATLWMYSRRPVFGRSLKEFSIPPATAKQRAVGQIDLVPTLALLLGLPIPFNNLGAPIEEAFLGVEGKDWENLAFVNRLTAAQIHAYQDEYTNIRQPDPFVIAVPTQLWTASVEAWGRAVASKFRFSSSQHWKKIATVYSSYCEKTLKIFRALWTQFGPINMIAGISITILTLISLLLAVQLRKNITHTLSSIVPGAISFLSIGIGAGYLVGYFIPDLEAWPTAFFGGAALLGICLFSYFWTSAISYPRGVWSWISIISTLFLSIGFASNSYTIWEDEILLFFLATFGILMLVQSLRLPSLELKRTGCMHSVLFLVCVRLASLSRLCREEQSRYCQSTFYASATSSTSAPWQVLIPYLVAVLMPMVVRRFYETTQSYHGSAVFWIGVAFRTSLLLIAVYWSLDAADDGDWLVDVDKKLLKSVRMYIAQLVLVVALGAGTAIFAWQSPFIGVVSARPRVQGIEIQGLKNLYGSHYAILPFTVLLIPLLLLQKPMGQYALALVTTAVFSLLEVLSVLSSRASATSRTSRNQSSASAASQILGPVILALLGHFAFFKTGHQAALASIQWDVAYIPSRKLRLPWSALVVVTNTFAGQILCAAAVPLTILWRRQYTLPRPTSSSSPSTETEKTAESDEDNDTEKRGRLLTELSVAHLTHVAVYAVINLATTLWAAHLRRHLMLYRVFCPRWMLGSAALILVECVSLFVGLGGSVWSFRSIGDLFGW